jgi:protein-tyrosine phosphatase
VRDLLKRWWTGDRPLPEGGPRVLLVCMGNICRSPMAEGVLRHRLALLDPPLPVLLDSAGTHGYHAGAPPDPRAQAATLRRGVDIAGLRARRVVAEDFARFDLLLAMDTDNLAALRGLASEELQDKAQLYLEFAGLRGDVPDPYYGGISGFERVLDLVESATDGIVHQLQVLAEKT